ncbi:MAG: putative CopG family antitoxin [Kiritimatiellia bacterium]|jgi:predicted CopG family antitoxin
MRSRMHDCMKTISLTDEAYKRLKEWKDESNDSFSKVVLKVVPEKGTLGQMLEDVKKLPTLSPEQARVMEESARYGRDPEGNRDPWTS